MKYKYLILTLITQSISCCKKEINLKTQINDNRIIGAWQCEGIMYLSKIDSLIDSNIDTIYSKSYKGKKILMKIVAGFNLDVINYGKEITGSIKLFSPDSISLNLIEIDDKVLRPNSDYQPIFINNMNKGNIFWIEGDGSIDSKLFIQLESPKSIIKFKKI
jgi:hypothetical protein